MKATVAPLEGNKVKLSVEVDEQEFERAVDAAVRRIARDVRIPGFRPGKAPRRVLEARIGTEHVRQEALRESLPGFYAQAVRDTEIDAIAAPEIDITGGEASGPLQFDAVVEVRPEIRVPGYEGLEVTVPRPSVTDEEVEAQVDRLRGQFATLEPVERPVAAGDVVTIDLAGTKDGEPMDGLTVEDYLYEVGSASIVDELDDALLGAEAGEERSFSAKLSEDNEVDFTVKVKEVKERILPELTDEWAAEASEFDSVEALRADLSTRMTQVKKMQATMALRDKVVEALAELVADDPPESLVNAEVERRLQDLSHRLSHQGANLDEYLQATGQDGPGLVAGLKEAAAGAVKADLALRAVAVAEGIEVDDDDIDAEIASVASQYDRTPAQLRRELERGDQMPAVRSDLRKAKALEWLIEHVRVVDEDGTPVDRSELEIEPEPAPEGDGAEPEETEETAE